MGCDLSKNQQALRNTLLPPTIFRSFGGIDMPLRCESACVWYQPAVTIEEIEKHIIEIVFEKGTVKPKNKRSNGKKVAVIGSTLSLRQQPVNKLNYAGHSGNGLAKGMKSPWSATLWVSLILNLENGGGAGGST